jgi:hypothetical protein
MIWLVGVGLYGDGVTAMISAACAPVKTTSISRVVMRDIIRLDILLSYSLRKANYIERFKVITMNYVSITGAQIVLSVGLS